MATGHTNTTVPNKLFDYMACGLPVVASDAIPLKRIITEENCAVAFRSGDSKDLTRAIWEVYCSKVDYGENGKKAAMTKYNWQIEETRLLNVVLRMIS